MQLLEREYRATQPIAPVEQEQERAYHPHPRLLQRAPRTAFQAVTSLMRVENTPALVTPVVVGTVLAWWETGQLRPSVLVMALVGLAMGGWAFVVLNDYVDYQFSRRPGTRYIPDPLYSGFGLMERAILKPVTVRDIGRILLAIGALCGLWLAVLAGWPLLFFSGLSFLFLSAVVLLPLKYGHRGWGLAETAIFVALGLLPLLGSYYAQRQMLSSLPLAIGIPFSLLTALIFFNHNVVYFRRDWLIHKRTLTVNLGLARSLDISALVTVLAHIGILLGVVLTDLPLSGLVALAALPIGLGVFAQLERETLSVEACLRVYQTSVSAVALAGGLLCAALLIDKLL